MQGAPAQAVPAPGPAVHSQEVPLPHPRDGLVYLPAHPAGPRRQDREAAEPRHGGGHHEVLRPGGAGPLGQGLAPPAAAPRGGGHAQTLLQQEEEHQVPQTACSDGRGGSPPATASSPRYSFISSSSVDIPFHFICLSSSFSPLIEDSTLYFSRFLSSCFILE